MQFDILVDGKTKGTVTLTVDIPKNLQMQHGVTEAAVLKALQEPQRASWYCMGSVEVRQRTP